MTAFALLLAAFAYAQRPDQMTTCASFNGQRTLCDVDTQGGVSIGRAFGPGQCIEGRTWGYTERGIWVDRDCRADFFVSEPPRVQPSYATYLLAGTEIMVRTDQLIDARTRDYQEYWARVDQRVRDEDGDIAIPRGAPAQLVVRMARDGDLILDLDSIYVGNQRYAVNAVANRLEAREGQRPDRRTGEFAAGGAVLGSIVGAIAGGGKSAAIGAITGAAVGAGGSLVTGGSEVHVPEGSVLTFELRYPLDLGRD